MSIVVIDQRGAELGYQHEALVVRLPEQPPKTIPLRLIDRLVLAASVQVNSSLLTHLADYDIAVTAMPGRGYQRHRFMHATSHGDGLRRLGQYAQLSDTEKCLGWARRFVAFKIAGDKRLLRRARWQRPDLNRVMARAEAAQYRAVTRARQAPDVDSLRGIEGAASAAFFKAYCQLFPAELAFHERNRRPPRDPVNAALSLGYTLAHGEAVAAVTQVGLDPMLGFLHEPVHNRESLACDLVELVRPRIEYQVWQLFARQKLRARQFSQDGGASRMNKEARRLFFAEHARLAMQYRRWLRRYAIRLARDCYETGRHHPRVA